MSAPIIEKTGGKLPLTACGMNLTTCCHYTRSDPSWTVEFRATRPDAKAEFLTVVNANLTLIHQHSRDEGDYPGIEWTRDHNVAANGRYKKFMIYFRCDLPG